MTLNAFTSVSLRPLMVLVSLAHGSRTLRAVRGAGRYSVNLLGRDQRDAAIAFATTPDAPFPAAYTVRGDDGPPVVRHAVATIACELAQLTQAGDHDLALGRVMRVGHRGGEPLIFHRGRFGGLVTDAAVPAGHPIGLDEGAGW